jgi:hypothetical protein
MPLVGLTSVIYLESAVTSVPHLWRLVLRPHLSGVFRLPCKARDDGAAGHKILFWSKRVRALLRVGVGESWRPSPVHGLPRHCQWHGRGLVASRRALRAGLEGRVIEWVWTGGFGNEWCGACDGGGSRAGSAGAWP